MKTIAIAIALLSATPVAAQYSMTYYLTAQWTERGNRFCRYSNGSILNVGYSFCPYTIGG